MPTWVSIKEVAKKYGVSTQSIRNWTRDGQLEAVRTPGNHRRYDKEKIDGNKKEEKITVLYSRVSSNDQKEDLVRQQEEIKKYCEKEGHERVLEIAEIGSGLNYKKRGFLKLLELLLCGNVERIVINYKDRLMRFGNEIIEEICRIKNVSLIVLNKIEEENFETKLAQDIISILTVFCAKVYGKRSHAKKLKTS